MKCPELRVKAVAYLRSEVDRIICRPHKLSFPAKVVADAVGGYAGTIGLVADQVVFDLQATGIDCMYDRNKRPTAFSINLLT